MPTWGLKCPVDKTHGNLLPPRAASGRWYCPHSAHGGNGKFFSDKEAHGDYTLEESDVTVIYESAAHDVIAGRTTLDQAVQSVARSTGRSTSQVREAIAIMVDTIREKDTDMAEQKKSAKAAAKAKAAKQPGERKRKEFVDASEFVRVRDELGLTPKQSAEATGEAGMGASATYVYILTHQGASKDLFVKYEAALRAYAKKNKIKKPKVVAEAAEPEAAEVEAAEAGEAEVEEPEGDLVTA